MVATTFTAASASPRVQRPPSSCAKLDGVATWLINGLTGAFFASLERCSCIRISTNEDDLGDEANDLPLISNDGNYRSDQDGRIKRRSSKGRAFDHVHG